MCFCLGGVFNSGHFKATPQGQRRRWCDYTPTEVWPATPSPGGHDGMCSFGVPATGPAIAVSTSPSAAVGAGEMGDTKYSDHFFEYSLFTEGEFWDASPIQ